MHPTETSTPHLALSASFFQSFEANSNACDLAGFASQFSETFLAAGPQGSQPVRRADFLQFLPKRHQMLAELGCARCTLASARETALGKAHLLVETRWNVEVALPTQTAAPSVPPGAPIQVASTFLLEGQPESWKIIFYLAHDDLAGLLRERSAGASKTPFASDCPPAESKVN